VPSDLVMVPSVPVTPDPAVAGPLTGGQKVAHDPVHFDVVEVSGTNQYKVSPLAFVSTTFPLMVLVDSTVPAALDDAGLDGAELDGAALDGAGADAVAATGLPLRSPERSRSRLGGFQRGTQRAQGQTSGTTEGADH